MENDFCNIFPGLGLLDSLESETVQILRTYYNERDLNEKNVSK